MNILFLFVFIFFFNLIIYLKFSNISKNFIFFDKPDGNLKKHEHPVSLIGGLIVLVNFYLIIFFLKISNLNYNFFDDNFIYFIVTLSTCFYFIGLIDDFG